MKLLLVAAVALIDPEGRVLLAQRPEGKSLAGLWEFPGGKVDPGETPETALIRELDAGMAEVLKGSATYKTLLIWPYAVAPAVAAVLWIFLFNPGLGLITHFLNGLGYNWNHAQNSGQAMFLVVFASVWKQISYNFLFFLAGLQSIPKSVIEAAVIDGARPMRRFWTIGNHVTTFYAFTFEHVELTPFRNHLFVRLATVYRGDNQATFPFGFFTEGHDT